MRTQFSGIRQPFGLLTHLCLGWAQRGSSAGLTCGHHLMATLGLMV